MKSSMKRMLALVLSLMLLIPALAEDTEQSVQNDVVLEELDIAQPTLSYHMKILRQSGIVKERSVGPWKYYSIDSEGCAYAQKLLQALSFGGEKVEIKLIRALAKLGGAVPQALPAGEGLFSCKCPCPGDC